MAINFSGEFAAPRSPDEVFDFLSDPNKFGPLLPDFQSMSTIDPTHFAVKVRVGVGNIRGTAEIKMELTEALRPVRALYQGQGTAVGSQVTVSAGFDLSPLDAGTRVAWQGEANVFGKLASMAGGMLEPLGRKNIQRLIDGLQKALAELAPSTATPASEQGEMQQIVSTPEGQFQTQIEAPQPAADTPGVPQSADSVEAPDFSPVNAEPPQDRASAPDTPPPAPEVPVDDKN